MTRQLKQVVQFSARAFRNNTVKKLSEFELGQFRNTTPFEGTGVLTDVIELPLLEEDANLMVQYFLDNGHAFLVRGHH